MWMFTVEGFVSVVQHRSDPDMLIVRGRQQQHLINIAEKYNLDATITESSKNDYRYRMTVHREEWMGVASSMVGDIDYFNFKEGAQRNQLKTSRRYITTLSMVWNVMFDFQRKVLRDVVDKLRNHG